ncbi:MAG: amino acid permease [Verrucomicrobia bacterium]|nr:amino acid permease [Verrucomicrobiota bacterium]
MLANKKISFFSLVVLIVAAIDNMRNLPAAAMFGSELVFFFLFSALVFLIPTALMSAELSAAFPEAGGIYRWIQRAFGDKPAMFGIWLQWINTMVWYPTMLSFIAGTLAYLIDPALAQNKTYLISCILGIFWGLTWINLKGVRVSALVNNICAILGMVLPMGLLIVLGGVYVFSGHPVQIHLSRETMLPAFSDSTCWVSLIAIMASFLGMELSSVHINDVESPKKNFPRAVFVASLFIFLSMCLGSLSIASVVPAKDIQLVSGVMQVFNNFFHFFGLTGLVPVLTLSIALGSVGTMINWLISPAKGLLHAAEFGFLPSFFARRNKQGVPANILIAQGVLVTMFCLVLLFQPSINGFYWFFTALSTELYMIMYILMFCAGIRLHYSYTVRPDAFKIPGKQWGMWSVSLLGLIGCAATIIVSFFPPGEVDVGTSADYLMMIGIGNIATICPIFLFFFHKRLICNQVEQLK